MRESFLVLEKLTHRHPGAATSRPDSVSGEIRRGEWVCLAAPNGAGKTTLLRAMAGLLQPASGRALLRESGILPSSSREFRRRVAYLAQHPHEQILGSTVGDELSCALEWHGTPGAEIRSRVGAAVASLPWEGGAGRSTAELSGGQRRRLALLAATLPDVEFLLVDEPLAGLDPFARSDWLRRLRGLLLRGIGVLSTSTSAAEASRADRVWCLRPDREGLEEFAPGALLDPGLARSLGLRPIPTLGADEVAGSSAAVCMEETGTRRISGARLSRGGELVWKSLDLEIPAQGLAALWAPNGGGKTTLSLALAGLLRLEGGRVEGNFGWQGLGESRRCHSAMIFQHPEDQLGGATVREEWQIGGPLAEAQLVALAAKLGLPEECLGRAPHRLSAGERRRVALGILEGLSPELILLDEPLVGLDGPGAAKVSGWVRELARDRAVWWFDSDLELPEIALESWVELIRGHGIVPLRARRCSSGLSDFLPWGYGAFQAREALRT